MGGNSVGGFTVGVCITTDLVEIFGSLPPACSNANQVVSGFIPGNFSTSIKTNCEEDCAPVLGQQYEDRCYDPSAAIIQDINCVKSEDASLGSYCNFVGNASKAAILTETFLSVEIACNLNSAIPPTICTDECRQRFMIVVDRVGCCYQTFYNDSSNLDYLYTSGTLGSQDKVLLEQLRDPVYWEQCEVDLITACGATQVVASFVVMLMTLVSALLF